MSNEITLNPKDFPILSNWSQKRLHETLEQLSRKANTSKTEITQEDLQWSAKMLEME